MSVTLHTAHGHVFRLLNKGSELHKDDVTCVSDMADEWYRAGEYYGDGFEGQCDDGVAWWRHVCQDGDLYVEGDHYWLREDLDSYTDQGREFCIYYGDSTVVVDRKEKVVCRISEYTWVWAYKTLGYNTEGSRVMDLGMDDGWGATLKLPSRSLELRLMSTTEDKFLVQYSTTLDSWNRAYDYHANRPDRPKLHRLNLLATS